MQFFVRAVLHSADGKLNWRNTMNTNRVYDISGWVVLVTILTSVVAWVVALSSPSWAISDNDINGAWAVVALSTLVSGIILYGYVFGQKTYGPLSR